MLRRGSNPIAGATFHSIGTVITTGIYMYFDAVTGDSQAALDDSGGPLFYKNGATWELAGILSAIGAFTGSTRPNGQPGGTAVVGDATISVDHLTHAGPLSLIVFFLSQRRGLTVW